MVDDDRLAFAAVLNGLAAIKPGAKLTPESLEIYWMSLNDWPLDEFRAAAAFLAHAIEFMPNPFHFAELRRTSGDNAGEAWAEVLAIVRSGDYRRGVTVGGLADRVVRAMGGYDVLAMSATDAIHFRERRFAELWEQLGAAINVRAALPGLNAPANSVGVLKRGDGPHSVAALLGREPRRS